MATRTGPAVTARTTGPHERASRGTGPRFAPAEHWAGAVLVLALLALFFRLGTPVLLEDPNDGQYAEVAREMFAGGDWISPTLNGVLFLNKPPLLYWLIASCYSVFGVHEASARLPGALAGLATAVLLVALGRELWGMRAGLLAAAAWLAMPATWIELRFVRPDSLLAAAVTAACLASVRLVRADAERGKRAFLWLQAALAAGMMAKGAVAPLLWAPAMAALIAVTGRLDVLRRLLAPHRWWLFFALAAPWHVVAAFRHEGFLWDYIIQQHFLFFFDMKVPRDSIPVSLGTFWAAFSARAFPWTAVLALAAPAAWRLPRGTGQSLALLGGWIGGTLLLFSAAASRLEHYCVPALPGCALAIGGLLDRLPAGRAWRAAVAAALAAPALGLAFAAAALGDLIENTALAAEAERLVPLGATYLAATAAGLLAAGVMAWRRPHAVPYVCAVTALTLTPLLHQGFQIAAPYRSSDPVAALVRAVGDGSSTVVFEAPIEYQHVAGLVFYLRRPVLLLRPEGFVEPAYLLPWRDRLFISRARFEALWREKPVVLVTDPLQGTERELDELAPEPIYPVAFVVNRWILANQPIERTVAAAGR